MTLSKSIVLLVGGCICQIHLFTQQTLRREALIVYQILKWMLGMKQRTRTGCFLGEKQGPVQPCSPEGRRGPPRGLRVAQVHAKVCIQWRNWTWKGLFDPSVYEIQRCAIVRPEPNLYHKASIGRHFHLRFRAVSATTAVVVCVVDSKQGSMVETRDGVTRRETRNRGHKWQAFGDK